MDRISRLLVSSITMKGMTFLTQRGHGVSFEKPQFKLSAFEAGLGVYGRSGIILNPVLGNRMSLGVIMTDAPMETDGRLEDFRPCEDCDKCIQACPAKAFDNDKEYPESWSRETCVAKRNEIAAKDMFCHNCFAACPAGTISDRELLSIKTAESFYKPHRFKLEFDVA
jgi:epoxyqueuosine reductase QueG